MSKIVTWRNGRLFVVGVLTAGMLVGCGNMTPTPPPVQCTAAQYVGAGVCKKKSTQSITDFSLPAMTVGEKVILVAIADSGLALVYSSKTPSICSVSSNQISALAVGECAVAANQAGDTKTLAAAEVVVKATVSAPVTASSKLTKTGMTTCGNDTSNGLFCTPEALGALYGLGQDGEVQAGQAMSYTVLNQNGAACVQDNVTGLIWEQKTDDGGLRDRDWTYTWYNPNIATHAGFAGYQNYRDYQTNDNQSSCGGSLTKCNTIAYVAALNAANYCAYSDWRMPSRLELAGLVNFGRRSPSINLMFVNSPRSWYWSASPITMESNLAWDVYLSYGNSYNYHKNFNHHVQTVRASQ